MRCTSDYSTNTIAECGGFTGFPSFRLWMAEASLRILSLASHLTKARALKRYSINTCHLIEKKQEHGPQ